MSRGCDAGSQNRRFHRNHPAPTHSKGRTNPFFVAGAGDMLSRSQMFLRPIWFWSPCWILRNMPASALLFYQLSDQMWLLRLLCRGEKSPPPPHRKRLLLVNEFSVSGTGLIPSPALGGVVTITNDCQRKAYYAHYEKLTPAAGGILLAIPGLKPFLRHPQDTRTISLRVRAIGSFTPQRWCAGSKLETLLQSS